MKSEEQRVAERNKEINEMMLVATRGNRARKFLKDEFWLNDMEPMLAKIQNEADNQRGWTPGSGKSLEDMALSVAYYSAVSQTLGEILRQIKLMSAAGEEAEAYLKKSTENAK